MRPKQKTDAWAMFAQGRFTHLAKGLGILRPGDEKYLVLFK